MDAPKVEYSTPKTMREACLLSSRYKKRAVIAAGGTDLVLDIKHQKIRPGHIINIKGITGKDYIIHDEKDGLRIGPLTTIHAIETSPVIREKFAVLAHAAGKLGTWQVRNKATIAGNLCHASPSAETVPALIVLGAEAKVMKAEGERTVLIENFFTGPGQTVLKPGEILTEIRVPNSPPMSSGVYLKHTLRKALDLAIAGVAVIISMDGDVLSDVKIALGAVAPTAIRAKKAEAILRGKKFSNDLLQKAGEIASTECNPIDDVRSSAQYRCKMVNILVVRAVKEALEQIKMAS